MAANAPGLLNRRASVLMYVLLFLAFAEAIHEDHREEVMRRERMDLDATHPEQLLLAEHAKQLLRDQLANAQAASELRTS